MNITQAINKGRQYLSGTESPKSDSQYLLCHVLACTSTYLHTWPEKGLSEQQQADYIMLLEQRGQGRPVAHLTGQRGFWSLDLTVNADTLIPRPDTELLVSLALEKTQSGMVIADLGTGSGAIALALASERADLHVLAMERSVGALKVAQGNAAQCKIKNIAFWRGDWLSAIADNTLDMIVSNPPYIACDDPHLTQGDVRFEPLTALVSGQDGLDDIGEIIEQARRCLKPKSWLLIEHGFEQAQAVATLFKQANFEQVQSAKDYGGNDRVTLGQQPL
jgi:release factor glutamine methyltransferase